jgi:hypothetical protein
MKQQAHLIQASEMRSKPSVQDTAGGAVEVYESLDGNFYMVDTVVTASRLNTSTKLYFTYCEHMKSFSAPNWNFNSISQGYQIAFNDNLETLLLPKYQSVGHYSLQSNLKLKTCQLGSVGYPVSSIGSLTFRNMTQQDLTITVYVDASSIADVPDNVKKSAPWGATNATIIYRSSTTGEILS